MTRRDGKAYELTAAELRDLTLLLQQGKPLPERYRFVLFEDKREVELVWNGKTRDVCSVVLPFQTLEHIAGPRAERTSELGARERRAGWTNKLIWGDNKLILSSLKAGALRQQIEDAGGLKLIYIDPPFDVGADFSMDIEVGDGSVAKQPSVIEQIAYRDTWGRGADSFISMIYERLILMRDLLAPDGSIYVHCDWRVNALLRLVLTELFGVDCFQAEIVYKRRHAHSDATTLGSIHDTIFFYSRSERLTWNPQYVPYAAEYVETYYRYADPDGRKWLSRSTTAPGGRGPSYVWNGIKRAWRYTREEMQRLHAAGRLNYTDNGMPRYKQYLNEMEGVPLSSLWTDMKLVDSWGSEDQKYPTQKPEALLERIIKASSDPGDLVADFFCGSGTTAAVAEKLGRKWLATDVGRFAIHTTRKRMIGVQRERSSSGLEVCAFEVLSVGRYQRQAYLGGDALEAGRAREGLSQREDELRALVLRAYRASSFLGADAGVQDGFFQGARDGRLIVIGPLALPVGRAFVDQVLAECRKRKVSQVDVLAFELELGLFPAAAQQARRDGIELAVKHIPNEVFDRRAVDAGEVLFYDPSFVEATPRYDARRPRSVSIELSDFSVHYAHGIAGAAVSPVKRAKATVIYEHGQLYELSQDDGGGVTKRRLTATWSDWVDYWAVDFEYGGRVDAAELGLEPGRGDGEPRGQAFDSTWQSFRTRQSRELALTSMWHEYALPGRYVVAVKVVDLFGNDTLTLLHVEVPG